MAVRELILDLLARDKASRPIHGVGDALDDLGDSADDAGRDVRKLDSEIERAESSLRNLAREFARTDDAAKRMDLTKAMRGQQAELRKLIKAQDLITPETKSGIVSRLGDAFRDGGNLARPAIVAGVAAALPVVAGLLSAAVVGGVTTGGIIGGVMLASRDARVKAAGKEMGEFLLRGLEEKSSVFIKPVLDSITLIKGKFREVEDTIGGIFRNSSRFVVPFVDDVTDGLKGILEGVETLTARAGPVMDSLGDGIRETGETIGDVFEMMSENGEASASNLDSAFSAINGTLRALGETVSVVNTVFSKLNDIIPLDVWSQWERAMGKADETTRRTGSGTFAAAEGFQRVGKTADGAKASVKSYAEQLDDLADANLDVFEAQTRAKAAIQEASAAIRKNGETTSANTEKGRANREALASLARQLNTYRDATIRASGAGAKASAVADSNYRAFVKAAQGAGMSASAARRLAEDLLGIKSRVVTVKANTGVAASNISALKAQLRGIDQYIPITVAMRVTGQKNASAALHAFQKNARAAGGPVRPNEPYLVGEHGPELIMPTEPGHVITASQTRQMMARAKGGGTAGVMSGGSTIVNVTVNVPPTANLADVGRQTAEALDAYYRNGGRRP